MMTTFAPVALPVDTDGWEIRYRVDCTAREEKYLPTFEVAQREATVHRFVCSGDLCAERPPNIELKHTDPWFDGEKINGMTTRVIQDFLGFPADQEFRASGFMDADEFHGRVLLALAMQPSDGIVLSSQQVPGSTLSLISRTQVGSLTFRLEALRILAVRCVERQRQVYWF